MLSIRIKVTKDILQKSMMCNPFESEVSISCPIALALKEAFNDVWVGIDSFSIHSIILNLPHSAISFIREFDDLGIDDKWTERLDLPELEFEVFLSDEVIDALPINIDEAIKIINQSETLELA